MKRLVIFDLDGTLLNTINDLGNATNYALRTAGFPEHSASVYPSFVGNGVSKLIERALPEEARSPEMVQRLRGYFTEYYNEHCADTTEPYQGIPELLSELNTRGIAVAVASNKYQEATSKLVQHFFPDIPWVAIEGQKPDFPVKPDPSVVFSILSAHPTPKAQVLYVGDSGVDMETARRACVESAGVCWGFRPVGELRRSYANHIITDPDDIIDLLDSGAFAKTQG